MTTKPLTQAELQNIEHTNRILQEHYELVEKVTNTTEAMLNIYVPTLRGYVDAIAGIRTELGAEVVHILQSARELKSVTQSTKDIGDFINAISKLKEILTPELVEQLRKVVK